MQGPFISWGREMKLCLLFYLWKLFLGDWWKSRRNETIPMKSCISSFEDACDEGLSGFEVGNQFPNPFRLTRILRGKCLHLTELEFQEPNITKACDHEQITERSEGPRTSTSSQTTGLANGVGDCKELVWLQLKHCFRLNMTSSIVVDHRRKGSLIWYNEEISEKLANCFEIP